MKDDKKNNSRKKINTKQKNHSKNRVILFIVMFMFAVLILILAMFLNSRTSIRCNKTIDDNFINSNNSVVFNVKNKKINNIKLEKTLTISKTDANVDYLNAIETTLKEIYDDIKLDYDITEKDDKLIIKLTYNKMQKYTLDNVFIAFENNNLSVNVISEDAENNYATFDLSKEYSNKNIIKIMEKANYKCN